MRKLAILVPGMGYHVDKPLLYYSGKIAASLGYEVIKLHFSNLPNKVMGDTEKMKQTLDMAYSQATEQLQSIDYSRYEDVLFIGKSVGTIVTTKYIKEQIPWARAILYTPLEATYLFPVQNALAFIGDADPWSDLSNIKNLSAESGIPLHIFPGCNHSLETSEPLENIRILSDVMQQSYDYMSL